MACLEEFSASRQAAKTGGAMKIVIFGLTISSSWGNGHATIWRGLCKALSKRGHRVAFFEKDVSYYAEHRDRTEIPGVDLWLYADWDGVLPYAKKELADADIGIVTSYCPDGVEASRLVLSSMLLSVFYDMDTPVTLKSLDEGKKVSYIGEDGLKDFDLVLSYTGGAALRGLKERLGARLVAPLYGCVDPQIHKPVYPVPEFRADLSYLGTYAKDRQAALSSFFIEPSRRLPKKRFLIGGSLYPEDFPWNGSIYYVDHVPPLRHSAFYCSSSFTLNVTRGPMAESGYCPSGRLFEAASCGTPVISDWWAGLDEFFAPGAEIVTARSAEDVIEALKMPEWQRTRLAKAALERTLEEHTAEKRIEYLEGVFDEVASGRFKER